MNIICVTCIKDLYPLQRQLESYNKYLHKDYKLIYVVEDTGPAGEIFTEYLKNYISKYHTSLNTQIYQADKWLPKNFDLLEGWTRQQLLKLLISAEQTDICHVVDSKNFLINKLDPISISASQLIRINEIEPQWFSKEYAEYQRIENIQLADYNYAVTPFVIEPSIVQQGIKNWKDGNFIEWWFDRYKDKSNIASEFLLYYVWYKKYSADILESYQHNVLVIWSKDDASQFFGTKREYIQTFDELFSLLNSSKKQGIQWIGINRHTLTNMDVDTKTKWVSWLLEQGYTKDYNRTDVGLKR
jgi:hypothetical protein